MEHSAHSMNEPWAATGLGEGDLHDTASVEHNKARDEWNQSLLQLKSAFSRLNDCEHRHSGGAKDRFIRDCRA